MAPRHEKCPPSAGSRFSLTAQGGGGTGPRHGTPCCIGPRQPVEYNNLHKDVCSRAILDVNHVAPDKSPMRRPDDNTDAGLERELARLKAIERDLESGDLAWLPNPERQTLLYQVRLHITDVETEVTTRSTRNQG